MVYLVNFGWKRGIKMIFLNKAFLKKTTVFLMSSVCCLISITALAEKTGNTNKLAKYLFVESAHSAEIIKDKDKPVGNYIIILKSVDPWVIYFSDRPKRDMGFMPVEDFLTKMTTEGEKFEPKGLNAAVVSLDDKHKVVSYVFTLHHPQYDGKNASISFTAQTVPGKTLTIIPSEVELSHVAVFIDACVGCVGPP